MKKAASATHNSGYTLFELLITVAVLSVGISFLFPAFFQSGNALNGLTARYEANLALNNLLVETEEHIRTHDLKEWPKEGRISMGRREFPYRMEIKPAQVLRKGPLEKPITVYRLSGSVVWSPEGNKSVSGVSYVLD